MCSNDFAFSLIIVSFSYLLIFFKINIYVIICTRCSDVKTKKVCVAKAVHTANLCAHHTHTHTHTHTHKITPSSVCVCLCMCVFMRVGLCVSVFGKGHFAKSTN